MGKMFFQKLGHEELSHNAVFMKLNVEVKGVYFEMRLFVHDTDDGSFRLGKSKRATVGDLVEYYSDGTKARRNWVEKVLKKLVAAGVVKLRGKGDGVKPEHVVILSTFEDEQDLGRPDALRKRADAKRNIKSRAEKVKVALGSLFEHADKLPLEAVCGVIKRSAGCYGKTLSKYIELLRDEKFLVVDVDGLCSLASLDRSPAPPGAGSGAGCAGAGAEFSGARNIPLEPEPESEPELEGTYVPPAGPAGARARLFSGGGAGERSSEADGSASSGGGLGQQGRRAGGTMDDSMHSPEDAWHVPDPLHAAELFLSQCKGWDDTSRFSLRAKWKKSRRGVGPKEADRIWRQALFDIALEKADRAAWRSFVAVFQGKVERASLIAADEVKANEG